MRRHNTARTAAPAWYFASVAILAGASVSAFAMLPLRMGGLVSFVAVVTGIAIDRFIRDRFDARPRGAAAIGYLIFSASVLVASLGLVTTVARGEALWLGVLLAATVALVFVGAAWIPPRPRGHRADAEPPRPEDS